VYFSQTGEQYGVGVITKGNTEIIAEMIAAQTKADLFHVETVASYPFEYKAQTDVAMKELRAKARPAIKGDVKDFDSYDTVLIGYPIWWGIAAWPVDNFVKGNDFTGKTVIPFCTSSSSGLGDSGNLLEEMAGTGDWQEGHRFSSGASDADAADWVASLNLNE
jgi:flavodoxin